MTTEQAQPRLAAVERLYALDGGVAIAPDRSMYSPGVGAGEPVTLSCNAYLIRRYDGWTLWDTGIDDALAEMLKAKLSLTASAASLPERLRLNFTRSVFKPPTSTQ